jgi:O-antigen/teichoic acid export membrane protein
MEATVGALSAIHLVLGCALAFLTWWTAPYAAHRLAIHHGVSFSECLTCLRVASAAILVRAIEAVPVCVQRAFEEYRGTVSVSVAVRLLTLSAAAILAARGGRVVSIMVLTLFFLTVGTCFQFLYLARWVKPRAAFPDVTCQEVRALFSSGVFVWIQAVSSVLFRQLDRILLGLSMGAAIVAPYSLSIQISEPLFGLTASSLSFFFPYLAGRAPRLSPESIRATVRKAFVLSLVLIFAGAAILLGFGEAIMRAWAGRAIAHSSRGILPLIVMGSALSGLSVVGTYGAQALGMFRIVAFISILTRCALLMLMLFLLHHRGLFGLAMARLCYGAASLSVYLPLVRRLSVLSGPVVPVPPINHAGRLRQEGQV